MAEVGEEVKRQRIVKCIDQGLDSVLGKNTSKALYYHFQLTTKLNGPSDIYNHPDEFTHFLNSEIPGAAKLLEKAVVDAIKASYILPKEGNSISLKEAISLAKMPVIVRGDATLNEVEAKIVKCVQYALRNLFSENAVQVVFQNFVTASGMQLKAVATRPELFSKFLRSVFGPTSKAIEVRVVKEFVIEFEEMDIRPGDFVDIVNRLRMNFAQTEVSWSD